MPFEHGRGLRSRHRRADVNRRGRERFVRSAPYAGRAATSTSTSTARGDRVRGMRLVAGATDIDVVRRAAAPDTGRLTARRDRRRGISRPWCVATPRAQRRSARAATSAAWRVGPYRRWNRMARIGRRSTGRNWVARPSRNSKPRINRAAATDRQNVGEKTSRHYLISSLVGPHVISKSALVLRPQTR